MIAKNAKAVLTTTMDTIYTAPAGGARISLIQIANIDGTNPVDVSVQWTDYSDNNAITSLCSSSTVKPKDALSAVAGVLYLEEGDTIEAAASANGDAAISVCALVEA
jgi:hypothetical protein